MKAAIVRQAGLVPIQGDFAVPIPAEGERLIGVTAAALSPLTRARASGSHYSSSGHFPFVAGVDGVGRLDDGRRVYFVLPRAPYGALAEMTVASTAHCVALPDELDDVRAAAIANPGMSSWAAFVERARLRPGETVLVNGATGASGQLAVRIARHFGAKRIIATGRDRAMLAKLGADATIPLIDDDDALEAAFREQFEQGVDVIIDYLWGRSAERLLLAGAKAGRDAVPIRFVQVGTASGADITLSGAVLRSTAIELMGSGIGSVPLDRLVAAVGGVMQAAIPAGLDLPTQTVPLADIEAAWPERNGHRIVVTIGS